MNCTTPPPTQSIHITATVQKFNGILDEYTVIAMDTLKTLKVYVIADSLRPYRPEIPLTTKELAVSQVNNFDGTTILNIPELSSPVILANNTMLRWRVTLS